MIHEIKNNIGVYKAILNKNSLYNKVLMAYFFKYMYDTWNTYSQKNFTLPEHILECISECIAHCKRRLIYKRVRINSLLHVVYFLGSKNIFRKEELLDYPIGQVLTHERYRVREDDGKRVFPVGHSN